MACYPCCSDLQGLLVLDKFGAYGVGAVVVEDEDVLVPTLTEDQELSCLVGV